MINFSKQGSKLCCSWTAPRLLSLSVLYPYIPASERRGDRTHRAAVPLPREVGKGCECGWEQPPCSATSEICRGAVCHPRPLSSAFLQRCLAPRAELCAHCSAPTRGCPSCAVPRCQPPVNVTLTSAVVLGAEGWRVSKPCSDKSSVIAFCMETC